MLRSIFEFRMAWQEFGKGRGDVQRAESHRCADAQRAARLAAQAADQLFSGAGLVQHAGAMLGDRGADFGRG